MKTWAVPAAIIVCIEYMVALAIGARVGFHYAIPFSAYLIAALVVIVAALVLLLVFRLAVSAKRGDVPLNLHRGAGFAVGASHASDRVAVLGGFAACKC